MPPQLQQINVTLGTAGHIDHGKTSLVKCLTGCDTDRLKIEKQRGMSIELGFAPCTIADMQVGIVDVPGHENFIKTMVAGASGMDAVLLVVAADDGVMPQTREHLDILTLVGVRHGMVALTKIDRVDPEQQQLARAEVEDFVRGTFLEGTPILPVSCVTAEGFDAFFEALVGLMAAVRPKPVDGVFRLPVDRAFSAKGHGTVVAGIPVCGSAHLDDEVVLLPQGLTGRIRGIEVYGHTADTVMAGQCAALNVRHWDHRQIGRGNTLAVPGYFTPRMWYACTLRLLPIDGLMIKSGARVKFHTGTSEIAAAVYPMQGDRLLPGEEQLVQIRTSEPIVAGPGDHFILRTLSPVQTVGGGRVVEAVPGRLKRNRPNICEDLQERAGAVGDQRRFAEYCAKTAPARAASAEELAVRTKLTRSRLQQLLDEMLACGQVIRLGPDLYMHRQTAADTGREVLALLADFHQRSPASPGMTLDELRLAAALENDVLDGVLAMLKGEGRLVKRQDRLATVEHRASFGEEEGERLATIESLLGEHPFDPPGVQELVDKTGVPEKSVQRILKILCEHKRAVRVAEGLWFHQTAVERARAILVDFFAQEERLESVRFKYLLDTTRKFAIPLLDYFDQTGVTRRVGNTRYLKKAPGARP